jgi:hypothetical protein
MLSKIQLRSSKAVEKIRKVRSFEEEFEISVKSLELIDNLEENIILPVEWVEARKGRLRPLIDHFGKALCPAIRLMQGVYPVPIELCAEVLTACLDEFPHIDKIYAYYPEDEKKKNLKTEEEMFEYELFKRVILYKFLMYDYLCVLNYGKPYKKLMADAVYDEGALLELLQVDKSFVTTPLFIQRIREKQLLGDWEYFDKIGKAIAKEPVRKDKYMFRAVILVARFWREKFRNMSYKKIAELLVEREILPKSVDIESFRKVLNRNGLKKERYNRKPGHIKK